MYDNCSVLQSALCQQLLVDTKSEQCDLISVLLLSYCPVMTKLYLTAVDKRGQEASCAVQQGVQITRATEQNQKFQKLEQVTRQIRQFTFVYFSCVFSYLPTVLHLHSYEQGYLCKIVEFCLSEREKDQMDSQSNRMATYDLHFIFP